jgi:hypothetical protein
VSSVTPIRDPDGKLPVIDVESDEILHWVDEHQARELIKAGKVVILRTKRKIRGLGLVPKIPKSPVEPTPIRQRGTMGDSHNHERRDNPPGVWTIDHVGSNKRNIFLEVVTDCIVTTAEPKPMPLAA